ncbi:MAG TPA: riboflavin synthase [Terriglobales bacterium]|nr:riboflavin synthase [Terriglobales bacterium]
MFTGIIETVGRVVALEKRANAARLQLGGAAGPLRGLKRGDSIAVNGCCLTIVQQRAGSFSADLSPETLARTNLGDLQPGDRVNLEAPLRVGDALSGHLVQGHVEATGRLLELRSEGKAAGWRLALEAPAALEAYLVPQGSLTVDGISLTIAALAGQRVEIAIIPHTYRHTHLRHLRPGAALNLETDSMARHLERLLAARAAMQTKRPSGVTLRELRRQGF